MRRALSLGGRLSSIAKVTAISGPLGVLLDNQHGLFNVLNYNSNGWPFSIVVGDAVLVKSACWVPLLFMFAGAAMSTIQLVADELIPSSLPNNNNNPPSWGKTLNNIGSFALLYYISGALDYLQYDPLTINLVLSVLAVAGFVYFDGSKSGLLLALATALAGPLAEIVLINGPHLYTYTHADVLGIASWIPAVYFLGASAVGNLARTLLVEEDSKSRL